VRNYERKTARLYDLERDPGEERDLAASRPEKAAELDARLAAYLKDVAAQMAQPNPHYDPSKADDPSVDERRAGKGGKQGKKRNEK
jgi:uncharacterized protein YciW